MKCNILASTEIKLQVTAGAFQVYGKQGKSSVVVLLKESISVGVSKWKIEDKCIPQ